MPKIKVQQLDLYGSASRVKIDEQAVIVRHSAIVSQGRVARSVRNLIVSISVTASVKKLIAEAIKEEARKQTQGLLA